MSFKPGDEWRPEQSGGHSRIVWRGHRSTPAMQEPWNPGLHRLSDNYLKLMTANWAEAGVNRENLFRRFFSVADRVASPFLSLKVLHILFIFLAVHAKLNSVRTDCIPRVRNSLIPLLPFISPNTGSTVCCRILYLALAAAVRIFALMALRSFS